MPPTSKNSARNHAAPPRLVIENVGPRVEGGRGAVKRLLGDRLTVEADIYKDGHDVITARLRARPPGEKTWRLAPLVYHWDADRWRGEIPLDRIGDWLFTVEARPDGFATWRAEVIAKKAAGLGLALELLEGAEMVLEASRSARGEAQSVLAGLAVLLADPAISEAERADAALADGVAGLMAEEADWRTATRHEPELVVEVDRERAGFAAWYEMFPRSQATEPGKHGTFADAAKALDRIADLGFDVVYLPPIHPIGRRARKGRNNSLSAGPNDPGSPWAIGGPAGGHTAIEPALGTIEDFDRFVNRATALGLEVALDYALQCSPDHPWLTEHPDWFFARPDGTLKYAENPPKKYEDIYPINFWCDDREALWTACRDIVTYWMAHGVRTFRVDNPHTKPFAFWEWLIADIRQDDPDVVFLAEAFTRPKRMHGLARLGFTQSYTYFTWRNTADELRDYLRELSARPSVEYFRPNFFANTPDILHEYLVKGGRPAFRARLLLAATLSPLYGIYSGFELCENVPLHPGSEEYLDSEKYEIRQRNWAGLGHIQDDVRKLNRLRREQPALRRLDNVSFHPTEAAAMLFYRKAAYDADLLIVVNVDPAAACETMIHVPLADLGIGPDEPFAVEDLLSGERWSWRGARNYVRLDPRQRPGHVLRVVRQPKG